MQLHHNASHACLGMQHPLFFVLTRTSAGLTPSVRPLHWQARGTLHIPCCNCSICRHFGLNMPGSVTLKLSTLAAAAPAAVPAGLMCEDFTNCKSCLQHAAGQKDSLALVEDCTWCSSPNSGNPRCLPASQARGACELWLLFGPQQCANCEDQPTCRSCLAFPGTNSDGCLWCFEGAPTPRCITDTGDPSSKAQGCTRWFGSGPQECPASG
jgi:hypothetical protein